jgi:photosystem II stability/assembly factor-like uncharacterized protein
MKITRCLMVLPITMLLAGCVPAMGMLATSSFSPPGHWETIHQIDYYNLPKDSLKGDLGPAYSVYMVSLAGFETEDYGISIGPDDDARYTTDGGQTWTRASGELFCRHGLDVVDEEVAWHCGNGGTRVTTDGGQTWRTVEDSLCPYLSVLDKQTGWAASLSALHVTTDGGASWSKIALPPIKDNITAATLRTAKDGYLLDTAGNLFITSDGGQSWKQRSIGLGPDEKLITTSVGPKAVIRFTDDKQGMVVFDLSDGSVWFSVTDDGGQSWERTEISELRGQSLYYHLYLSHDGRLLTITDDFTNGKNISTILRYQQP